MTTEDSSASKSWRKGCGYFVASLIFFVSVTGFLVLRPAREASSCARRTKIPVDSGTEELPPHHPGFLHVPERSLDHDRLLRFSVDPELEDIWPRVVAGDVEGASRHTDGGQIDAGIDDPDLLA